MITALEEARTGAWEGGVPTGAVLVNAQGTVVATGRNRRLQGGACVMHAEINCLLNAGQKLSNFRGMTMYSTLIPCNMCAGAIVHSGIIEVVYGESRNLPEDNGRELLVRYGVELADLDLEEARRMIRAFLDKAGRVVGRHRPLGEERRPDHWPLEQVAALGCISTGEVSLAHVRLRQRLFLEHVLSRISWLDRTSLRIMMGVRSESLRHKGPCTRLTK